MARSMMSIAMCCAFGAAVSLTGCMESEDATEADATPSASESVGGQRSHGGTEIHTEDDCSPAADSGWGTRCNSNFNGHTTFPQFQAILAATKTVPAWEYGGGQGQVSSGQSLTVDNRGGETHTFTVVANFGGGRVPANNTASGNPIPAPECVNGPTPTNVDIASGNSLNVTTGANGLLKPGTYKVQCCLHPWMRTTVVVK
jgi:plastocyanin